MSRFLRLTLAACFLALLTGALGTAARAADDQAVSVAELEDLVAAIEDDSEREQLLSRLKALIELKKGEEAPAEKTLGTIAIEEISRQGEALGRQLSSLTAVLLAFPDGLAAVRQGLTDPSTRARWAETFLALLVLVLAGSVAQGLVKRILARPLTSIAWREGDGMLVRIPLLAARLLLILVPPAAFAAIGGILISLSGANSAARPAALALIYAVAVTGAIGAISRTLFSPGAPLARPLRLSDETAQYLHIWTLRISIVGVFGYFGAQMAGFLGLPTPAQAFLFKMVALLLALFLLMLILQNRGSVARAIAGGATARMGRLRRRLADLWHVLAILYVIAAYMVWATDMAGGFAYLARATLFSILAIGIGIGATGFIGRMIDRAFSLSRDVKARLPGLEARVNRYLPAVKTILNSIVAVVAALAVLQAWGLDALDWLAGPAGSAVMARLASIGAILLLALVAWEALSAAIERYLASNDATRSQRARTLLPLIRKVILAVLTVVVGLTVLSELGINIAPLLAGAGVVGLAVGFGAQTLVRDIITGLFILIEDTVSVGDYVTLAGHGGTVEALSIRSIRLRDPSGTVHTIPFSDVTAVINYTRDFAYAVLEIGVAYKEDTDRVTRVIEEVGRELRADPEQAPHILEDLQVQGVDQLADSAVVIKARIKTAPGMQWGVRRAFNRLVKRRFDAEKIEIPFPQQTVWFAEEPATDKAPVRRKKRPAKPAAEPDPTDEDL